MKQRYGWILFLISLVGMSGGAFADAVALSTVYLPSPLGNPTSEEGYLEGLYGLQLTYLNKYDAGTGWADDGGLAGSYFTVSVTGSTASVSWNLSGSGFELAYILLKDGNVPGSGHLYSIWTVTPDQKLGSGSSQSLYFGGAPPDNLNKNISHISFFGVPSRQVPEPTTLTLLGFALLAFALVCRRRL